MTRDQVLALINEIEAIIRKQLGAVGVAAVRPALQRVAAGLADEFRPEWKPDEILTDRHGRRFVTAPTMARECKRHGVEVDHRFLAPFGHVPSRMYVAGAKVRVWSLPD